MYKIPHPPFYSLLAFLYRCTSRCFVLYTQRKLLKRYNYAIAIPSQAHFFFSLLHVQLLYLPQDMHLAIGICRQLYLHYGQRQHFTNFNNFLPFPFCSYLSFRFSIHAFLSTFIGISFTKAVIVLSGCS